MEGLKEKDLKVLKELETSQNAESLESDAELSAEELDGVSGGGSGLAQQWLPDPVAERKKHNG